MKYEMKLQAPYFEMIKDGTKIFEIRLNDEKRRLLKVGDVIAFKNQFDLNDTLEAVVEKFLHFSSFEDMAKTLPAEQIGFSGKSLSEIVEVYHQFYSTADEEKFGVLAIKLKVKNF